ncbi:6864_t:CDS:2 [Diversispora eburnea]|uniref:6864_t:CDS:1 n=1 Tax=Diversispora eburnea TaxID=1213867 RepID=A0A9N8V741_9GLOM|nr:6864_t:CDS:2 [Diversispora eburnea]
MAIETPAKRDAIIAQSKADTTIVNLLRPSIAYENKGGKIEDRRRVKI